MGKLVLILVGLSVLPWSILAENGVVKEFPVEPLTRYRLSFDAETPETSSWRLEMFTEDGSLPYEGVYAFPWQTISNGKKRYQHEFHTPASAALLKLIVGDDSVKIENVDLKPVDGENLLVNGDFSLGPGNYSGWNVHEGGELKKIQWGNGEPTAFIASKGGFIVSDPIPVVPGESYRISKRSQGVRGAAVMGYSSDLLRTCQVKTFGANKPFNIPAGVHFVRIAPGRVRGPMRGFEIKAANPSVKPEIPSVPPFDGEIVLKPNSAPAEERAAREIAHWVRMISGKRLPTLARPTPKDNTKIFIGKTFASERFPNDLTRLRNSDGFAVRKQGKNIYIFGDRPRGALFGACRFIEKNTDLIWARPRTEFGTVYSKNPDLTFTETSFISIPTFKHRVTGHYRFYAPGRIWQGRNGLNTSPIMNRYFEEEAGAGDSVLSVPFRNAIKVNHTYEDLKANHPDYFALINGKRRIYPNSGYFCFTNPEVPKVMAEGISTLIDEAEREGREIDTVNLGFPDGWDVCACEECLKDIKLENGDVLSTNTAYSQKAPLFFSTRMFMMLNKVAELVAEKHPDVTILALAYIYTSEPPGVETHPAISPFFCAYSTSNMRFPILDGAHNGDKAVWQRRYKEWLRRNKERKNLSLFTYLSPAGFSAMADAFATDVKEMVDSGGCHYVRFPFAAPDVPVEETLKFYKPMGCPWNYRAMEQWDCARLAWDPGLDPQKLREYYIQRAYREAAPEMLEFYNIMRNAWSDKNNPAFVNCHTSRSTLFRTFIVDTGNEKRLRNLLVKAVTKAKNPNAKELIKHTLSEFDAMAKGLGREFVPFISEITPEWRNPDSTFYLQGVEKKDFKMINTHKGFKRALAKHQTNVRILRDDEFLYFRIDALDAADKNDKVEIALNDAEKRELSFLFSATRDGRSLALRNYRLDWGDATPPQWDVEVANGDGRYVVMFKIPTNLFGDAKAIDCKLVRVHEYANYEKREESSASGFPLQRRRGRDCSRLHLKEGES